MFENESKFHTNTRSKILLERNTHQEENFHIGNENDAVIEIIRVAKRSATTCIMHESEYDLCRYTVRHQRNPIAREAASLSRQRGNNEDAEILTDVEETLFSPSLGKANISIGEDSKENQTDDPYLFLPYNNGINKRIRDSDNIAYHKEKGTSFPEHLRINKSPKCESINQSEAHRNDSLNISGSLNNHSFASLREIPLPHIDESSLLLGDNRAQTDGSSYVNIGSFVIDEEQSLKNSQTGTQTKTNTNVKLSQEQKSRLKLISSFERISSEPPERCFCIPQPSQVESHLLSTLSPMAGDTNIFDIGNSPISCIPCYDNPSIKTPKFCSPLEKFPSVEEEDISFFTGSNMRKNQSPRKRKCWPRTSVQNLGPMGYSTFGKEDTKETKIKNEAALLVQGLRNVQHLMCKCPRVGEYVKEQSPYGLYRFSRRNQELRTSSKVLLKLQIIIEKHLLKKKKLEQQFPECKTHKYTT